MSQQGKGKTLGFSAVWRLLPQKRGRAGKTAGKRPLLLGLNYRLPDLDRDYATIPGK
jgi:hypothetical protein